MIDRRIVLSTVAAVLGVACLRWLKGSPAEAAEKFEIEKTDAEWRAQLTPQQYDILRRLRPAAVFLRDEVRKRNRLAELLQAARQRGRHDGRPYLRHGAYRSALPPLRRSSRPRLRRRPQADRLALLHGRFCADVPSSRGAAELSGWPLNFMDGTVRRFR